MLNLGGQETGRSMARWLRLRMGAIALLGMQSFLVLANATHELTHALGLEFLHGDHGAHSGTVGLLPRHSEFRTDEEPSHPNPGHEDRPDCPVSHRHSFQLISVSQVEDPPVCLPQIEWLGPQPVALIADFELPRLYWFSGGTWTGLSDCRFAILEPRQLVARGPPLADCCPSTSS